MEDTNKDVKKDWTPQFSLKSKMCGLFGSSPATCDKQRIVEFPIQALAELKDDSRPMNFPLCALDSAKHCQHQIINVINIDAERV